MSTTVGDRSEPGERRQRLGAVLLGAVGLLTALVPSLGSAVPAGAAEEPELVAGTLDWGVKESFRSYIAGPIAEGEATPAGGASENGDGTFRFPLREGSYLGAGHLEAAFEGSVRFTGHDGQLDLTLSEPRVLLDGEAGTLVLDAETLPLGAEDTVVHDDVFFAALDLSGVSPEVEAGQVVLEQVPAVLTEGGAQAFSGFYDAGTELDPVTLTLSISDDPDDPDATSTSTTEASTTSSTSEATTSSTSSTSSSSSSTTSSTTSSTAASTTSTTAPPAGVELTVGTLDWGVKESFRSYITGSIAHGEATTHAGASTNTDGTFRFPLGEGSYGPDGEVDASFDGSVRFTGHGGLLDFTISDPQVIVDGGEAVLVLDAESLPLGGSEPTVFDDIAFADLDLSAATPEMSDGRVVLAAVPATLTDAGAPAFAGFYEPGDELDPLTLTLSVDSSEDPVPTSTTSTPTTTSPPEADGAAGCLDRTTVPAGSSVTLCGDGFVAGEQVLVVLHSTPRTLSAVTADADGSVSATVTVPAGTETGSHRLELRGVTSGRSLLTQPFNVTADAGGGSLPRTGDDLYHAFRIAMVLLGFGLLISGRGMVRTGSGSPDLFR